MKFQTYRVFESIKMKMIKLNKENINYIYKNLHLEDKELYNYIDSIDTNLHQRFEILKKKPYWRKKSYTVFEYEIQHLFEAEYLLIDLIKDFYAAAAAPKFLDYKTIEGHIELDPHCPRFRTTSFTIKLSRKIGFKKSIKELPTDLCLVHNNMHDSHGKPIYIRISKDGNLIPDSFFSDDEE